MWLTEDRRSFLVAALAFLVLGPTPGLPVEVPPPVDKPVVRFSGNGFKNTPPFIVKSGWEAKWTDTSGNMNISLNDARTGSIVNPVFVITQQSNEGSSYHPEGGAYFFSVLSSGEWTITINELPLPK